MSEPGRNCRPGYRYSPALLAEAPEAAARCLYVIGGLYGNLQALEKILAMAALEPVWPTLVFNGDFNWFNIDDAGFVAINRQVLKYDATLGNVEAEFLARDARTGCGCAYPPEVDAGLVVRSNLIHARLRETAMRYRDIVQQMANLPMFRRYRVGGCGVCALHGDSQSLSGWGFDQSALRNPEREQWLVEQFLQAKTDIFASTHTCLPALRSVCHAGTKYLVFNNGSAGMPNFTDNLCGVIARISETPSPIPPLYGTQWHNTHIDALAVEYDQQRWKAAFLANWPKGTPAYVSYYRRICEGTAYEMSEAVIEAV